MSSSQVSPGMHVQGLMTDLHSLVVLSTAKNPALLSMIAQHTADLPSPDADDLVRSRASCSLLQ